MEWKMFDEHAGYETSSRGGPAIFSAKLKK
jgi:hypothetical protein